MKVDGTHFRTIRRGDEAGTVDIIDQTKFPHRFEVATLHTVAEAAHAIKAMLVRGAPLIGATAAYGMALAMQEDDSDAGLAAAYQALVATRPTAVNLRWALDRVAAALRPVPPSLRIETAWQLAGDIADEDVAINERIGENGLPIIEAIAANKGRVNVLTHCNAGWLATVDWGTATAPIYGRQRQRVARRQRRQGLRRS